MCGRVQLSSSRTHIARLVSLTTVRYTAPGSESAPKRGSHTVKRVRTKRLIDWTIVAVLGLAICATLSAKAAEPEAVGLDVVKVRKNFYMIAGAGGNIGVQIGSDGVVLVSSGTAAA